MSSGLGIATDFGSLRLCLAALNVSNKSSVHLTLALESSPAQAFSSGLNKTAWPGIHSVTCLKAPRKERSFFTVLGGGAFANGEKIWLQGSHLWPFFFQPKMVVETGAMISFFGLKVRPDSFALDKTVVNVLLRSCSVSASMYTASAIRATEPI